MLLFQRSNLEFYLTNSRYVTFLKSFITAYFQGTFEYGDMIEKEIQPYFLLEISIYLS